MIIILYSIKLALAQIAAFKSFSIPGYWVLIVSSVFMLAYISTSYSDEVTLCRGFNYLLLLLFILWSFIVYLFTNSEISVIVPFSILMSTDFKAKLRHLKEIRYAYDLW